MSFLFNPPPLIVDVGIGLVQGFIGLCWVVVIHRVISLGSAMNMITIPTKFLNNGYFFTATNSGTKNSWLSIGGEILFLISLIEVIFSIYCLYLIKCVQKEPKNEPRSFKFMKDLIYRVLSSGLEAPKNSTSTTTPTTKKTTEELIFAEEEEEDKWEGSERGKLPTTDFLDNPLRFEDPKAKDFRENHAVWFQTSSWRDIYRENHLEWLCTVLLGRTMEQLEEEDRFKSKEEAWRPRLEELVDAYEKRIGTKIPDGYNNLLKDKMIRPTKDPVKVAMRPLTLSYGFAWVTNEVITQMMKYNGFKLKQCTNRKNALKYLIRIPKSWNKLPPEERLPPIIFIHGIGMGFVLYISLIKYLTFSEWSKKRPVMVLIQPHISMQIFSPVYLTPPNQTQIDADMKEVFEDHDFNQTGVQLLAHSNGTVVAGWIIKNNPKLIRRCCLLDPVCFAIWEAYACYNFLYSKPKTGLQKLMRFGMGEELGIASYTRRHFNWQDAVLWPCHIPGFRNPKRFMVVLAGKDAIINASRIRRYLRQEGMSEASPMQITSEAGQVPASEPSPECQETIQVEIDQNGFMPDGGDLGGQSSKLQTGQIEGGGILFDPDSAHGQTLIFGHPFLKKILNWLESDDTQANN